MRCYSISDYKFRLILGGSTSEIHLMRQMIEYYRARKKGSQMLFIDFFKAYNKVLRNTLIQY